MLNVFEKKDNNSRATQGTQTETGRNVEYS